MFLSVAYSAQQAPSTLDGFYAAADHINCAIPTHEEIQGGINRLADAGLVRVEHGRFALLERGREVFERVCKQTPYPRMQPTLVEEHLRSANLPGVTHSHWDLSAAEATEALARYNKRMKEALKKLRA